MAGPLPMLPALEGDLQVWEVAFGSQESLVQAPSGSPRGEWRQRWCSLGEGIISVHVSQHAAFAQSENSLRSVTLAHCRKVSSSGTSSGPWEITIWKHSSSASTATPTRSASPMLHRGLPRSATSSSLSSAFERGAASFRGGSASRKGESESSASAYATVAGNSTRGQRPALYNASTLSSMDEATDGEGTKQRSNNGTWGKLSSRSKRLYRLVSGNSTSSLAELANARSSSPSPAPCSPLEEACASSDAVVLRTNSRAQHAQWLEAISTSMRSAGTTAPSPSQPSTSSRPRPALPSFASDARSGESSVVSLMAPAKLAKRPVKIGHSASNSNLVRASEAPAESSPRTSMDCGRSSISSRSEASSVLSARRPSTSNGALSLGTSRTSSSSTRRSSAATSLVSPALSAGHSMTKGASTWSGRSVSSPRPSPALSSDGPDMSPILSCAPRAGTREPRLSPSVESLRFGSRLVSVVASEDAQASRFAMLRKASASSMSGHQFSGACQGLGLDLGAATPVPELPTSLVKESLQACTPRLRLSTMDGDVQTTESIDSVATVLPSPRLRTTSRSPSLFSFAQTRGESTVQADVPQPRPRTRVDSMPSPVLCSSASLASLATDDMSATPTGASRKAGLPRLPGPSSRLAAAARRRLASPLTTQRHVSDASPSYSESASSADPTTPMSPLFARGSESVSLVGDDESMTCAPTPIGAPPPVIVERILPPTELIATFDRLRNEQQVKAARRTVRPRTSPSLPQGEAAPGRFPLSVSADETAARRASPRRPRTPRSTALQLVGDSTPRDASRPSLPAEPALRGALKSIDDNNAQLHKHSLPAPPRVAKRPSTSALSQTGSAADLTAQPDATQGHSAFSLLQADPRPAGARARGNTFSRPQQLSPIASPAASPAQTTPRKASAQKQAHASPAPHTAASSEALQWATREVRPAIAY